ncbi:hypothetical protein WMY93_027621 [Mugilogobius chulae]|uniref:SGNH hydrolase-type esterase domain-containing protein n=1 Tax=Mugilogobius chulae TaxID=88201 RepID=A0AAW0MTH6_9GOBI
MPRTKQSRRSAAARARKIEHQEKVREYQSTPLKFFPTLSQLNLLVTQGTGVRAKKAADWETPAAGQKEHKFVLPAESPDKKLVLVAGDSYLRSIVDGAVPFPEGCLSFAISCTPGASACHLTDRLSAHRKEMNKEKRDSELVCLLAPSNNLTSSKTIDRACDDFRALLTSACGSWKKVIVIDFPPRLSFNMDYQTALRQEYHRISAEMRVTYYNIADYFPTKDLRLWIGDGTHLSDTHGTNLLAQLMWIACYKELETPTPPTPVPVSPPSPPTSTFAQDWLRPLSHHHAAHHGVLSVLEGISH